MVVDAARSPARKPRWGELGEDDDGDELGFLLPPPVVVGPDEEGVKMVIAYKFSDDGDKVKTTTATLVRRLSRARLSKRALDRRSWPKFGDAADGDAGSRLTMVCTEEILLERPRSAGSKAEAPTVKPVAKLIKCRICDKQGDHWTPQCPYKDLARLVDGFIDDNTAASSNIADPPPGGTDKGGAYVPPSKRPGAVATYSRGHNDENSVRVTNLSEDTRDVDLLELFGAFGPVRRAFVAVDHKTGVNRGFGFVHFVNKEDAERAINKLNGYGYDNLILGVEWAGPRPKN